MPKYTANRRARAKKARTKEVNRFSRDKRILKRWATTGTGKDYENLRRVATNHADNAPSYISGVAVDELATVDKRRMLELIDQEPHGGDWFMDGLNWVMGLPGLRKAKWLGKLASMVVKPFQGDSMTETDQDYAKLVDATYREDRPEMVEHWKRLPEFDGKYTAAWESADGHVYIAVRGTKKTWEDLGQDAMIMMEGNPLSTIGEEIRRIVNSVGPDKTIDAGAHSLGTNLLLLAYRHDPDLRKRIHKTYLYNPADSPVAMRDSVVEDHLQDPTVRYFINLGDVVSSGLMTENPVNVVYRTGSPFQPLVAHDIGAWYPGTYDQLQTTQHEIPALGHEKTPEQDALAANFGVGMVGEAQGAPEPELGIVFGSDDFDETLASIAGYMVPGPLTIGAASLAKAYVEDQFW